MPAKTKRDHKLTIVERPIGMLKPYANNARTHSKAQVKKIARSIERWGWTNPIIIDQTMMVLCGHGRLEAAWLLGIEQVPTIMIEDMSEADKRAYILADNVIADKAGYSKELVASELEGLIDLGYEVELIGYDTIEIDTIVGIDDIDNDDGDTIGLPDPKQPVVSRLGDLWVIGNHKILCGDARDRSAFERLLAGELAQMVFTDPPYNVPIAGNVSGLGRHAHGDFKMASGEMSDQEFSSVFLRPVFRNIAAHSEAGAIAFVCMDWRGARQLLDAADGVFAELKNLIVWGKTNASMGTFYRSQHELIYAFKTSKGPHLNNFGLGEGGRHRSNLWIYAGANVFRRGRLKDLEDHPTVKPRKLVMDAILDVSKRNGLVLDAFAGAGTTLIAAERTGRRGAAIELDPAYVDLCVRNLERETGEIARLDTGETFAEISRDRAR